MTHNSTGIALFAVASLAACSNDLETVAPPISHRAHIYTKLDVNHHAILMSVTPPYDTVRLVTTPRDADGNEWTPLNATISERDSIFQFNPPVFISQDSSRVRVTQDGLVRAVKSTGSGTVRVIATRQLANVTWADTTVVRVTDAIPPAALTTFRLRPADSTKVAAGSTLPMVLIALDADNKSIANVVTYSRSTNPKIVTISGRATGWNSSSVNGEVSGPIGSARIVSEAYVYGVRMTDTVLIRTGYPISVRFSYVPPTDPNDGSPFIAGRIYTQVGPGAEISWENSTKFQEITIAFEDSTVALPVESPGRNSGGGNIIAIPHDSTLSVTLRTRYRRFLRPGTHRFKVLPGGSVGTIVVRDF